jgi:SOS-response transcriptional repressor LexA
VVNGCVEAGAWRSAEYWDDERTYAIEGTPSPVEGARRFGLVVVGRSMDEVYEPDTVLDCVSIFDTNVRPETGDHVICECVRSDGLRELTVKEYREEHGRYWLVPRSSRAEFKPVEYPGPRFGTPRRRRNQGDRVRRRVDSTADAQSPSQDGESYLRLNFRYNAY